jgi:hypothetical protein
MFSHRIQGVYQGNKIAARTDIFFSMHRNNKMLTFVKAQAFKH